MKLFNRQKGKLSLAICMMLLAAGLTGCGKEAVEEETPEISADTESGEDEENADSAEETDADTEEEEEPEEEELQYIELIEIEDYYGDNSLYELYVPKENENKDGYVYYSDHGLSYSAMVFGGYDSSAYLELSLKDRVEYDVEEWQNDERKAANRLPETILWFNATYAPLTYSNNCDWEKVGGMEADDYNKDFVKRGLSRDWGIEDKSSALETVERLLKDGHRAKCRECLEELDEMDLIRSIGI